MKTLQLVPAMEQGGVERGVVEINRALVAAGWSNTVVSSGGRLADQIAADGGKHVTLDVKSKNPFTFFSRARKLAAVLKAGKPDVVCAHSRVPAWLFVRANRNLGLKWISFAHGANSVSAYSSVMARGDVIVTPSNFVADLLADAYGARRDRIRVIPRAIDGDKFDPARLDRSFMDRMRREWELGDRHVVMALGRISRLKRYDILIRAVAIANAKRSAGEKRFKLVIVGEAEEKRRGVEADLRRLADSLGMAGDVVFAGNRREAAECLSLADVVVSSNTEKPEAFGRSMTEALAMGRPVVAKAFGGALDIVEDGVNGALVPESAATGENAPAAFADAILRVSRMGFGDLRSAAMEKFSFGLMVERTMAAYMEAAGK